MPHDILNSSDVIFDAVPDGVLIADIKGQILRVNRQLTELFGYTREQLLGQTVETLIPDRFGKVHARHREAFSKNPSIRDMGPEMQLIGKRRDGSEFPVEIRLGPISSADQTLFITVIRDRTKQIKLEQAFSELLNTAPDPTLISDETGTIVRANRAAEKSFGYSCEELIGQSIDMLVPDRFRHHHDQLRHQYNNHPSARYMGEGNELFARRKDGSEFPAEISLGPMKYEDGLLITSAVRDITERKKLENNLQQRAEALERSNQELEQFAYIASHDLQEPLRIIGSFAQLLHSRYQSQLGEEADEFIHYIVDGAKRMQDLINDLLLFSRISTRAQEFTTIDTDAAIKLALDNLRFAIQDKNATVTVEQAPDVVGDSSQLTQVFQNLIANAIKFCAENTPVVHISAQDKGDTVTFVISDNGIGIDPQFGERIFKIFQRLHGRGDYSGTGIGLAVCKKIIERHGGRIWIEPNQPTGTQFHFTLPKAHATAEDTPC